MADSSQSGATPWNQEDRRWMARALELAAKAAHACRPNPMVGAVLVRDRQLLGEGFHQKAGEAHAEIAALQSCQEDPRGSTMYVTLEPCSHTGKTPPCADALLQAGIRRVVVATRDPWHQVAGAGIQRLRQAGVRVEVGLFETQARKLNDAWVWQAQTGRPFMTLKLAMTLDGRIADGQGLSQWITGGPARERVQELRGQVDAILVGAETARLDNPSLTCRSPGYEGPQPRRLILSASGRLSPELRIFQDAPERTHIFLPESVSADVLMSLEDTGCHVERLPVQASGLELAALQNRLCDLGFQRILVEGGGRVAGTLLDAGWIQRVWLFYAPLLLGSGRPGIQSSPGQERTLSQSLRLTRRRWENLGEDFLLEGFLEDPLWLWDSAGK